MSFQGISKKHASRAMLGAAAVSLTLTFAAAPAAAAATPQAGAAQPTATEGSPLNDNVFLAFLHYLASGSTDSCGLPKWDFPQPC